MSTRGGRVWSSLSARCGSSDRSPPRHVPHRERGFRAQPATALRQGAVDERPLVPFAGVAAFGGERLRVERSTARLLVVGGGRGAALKERRAGAEPAWQCRMVRLTSYLGAARRGKNCAM